jgi:hypothetical protein
VRESARVSQLPSKNSQSLGRQSNCTSRVYEANIEEGSRMLAGKVGRSGEKSRDEVTHAHGMRSTLSSKESSSNQLSTPLRLVRYRKYFVRENNAFMAHIGARPEVMMAERHQGTKRRANDDLDSQQRLAKRFDLMHLGKYHFYILSSRILKRRRWPWWQTVHTESSFGFLE